MEGHLEPRSVCTPSPHQLGIGQPSPNLHLRVCSFRTLLVPITTGRILCEADMEIKGKNCETFTGMQDGTQSLPIMMQS